MKVEFQKVDKAIYESSERSSEEDGFRITFYIPHKEMRGVQNLHDIHIGVFRQIPETIEEFCQLEGMPEEEVVKWLTRNFNK